jgi:hypothetical protein
MATCAILMRAEYLQNNVTKTQRKRERKAIGVLGRCSDDVAVVVLPAHVGLHIALAGTEKHVAEEHVVKLGKRP